MPGDKDLEKVLSNISNTERKTAVKQAQIDRLREVTEKQRKVMADLENLINQQKKKIDSMFDVPADVVELKSLIGNQRSQLNDKDQKLEISYSKIAELEQELKGTAQTQNIVQKNFEETFSQIGTMKAELTEKNSTLSIRDNEIQNLRIKINELQTRIDESKNHFQKIIDENKEEISVLKEQIRKKDLEIIDSKSNVETELTTRIYQEKDEALKKIKKLESELLEKELSTKEKLSNAMDNIKAYEDMKKKYEELIKKYDTFSIKNSEYREKIEDLGKEIETLKEFKNKNESVVIIFNKLRSLLDSEPMFRIFGIVWDIGEISVSDLKNAIGIPSVTIKKYIQSYVDKGLLKVNDSGKVSLIDR
ncbi:MAG: hypothetical protein ACTSWY_12330 [Promethearchaeota archaeon]